MHRLQTLSTVPRNHGQMYLVDLPKDLSMPSWLVHAQIELDGKRVFVRMVDTSVAGCDSATGGTVGLVVSPVY